MEFVELEGRTVDLEEETYLVFVFDFVDMAELVEFKEIGVLPGNTVCMAVVMDAGVIVEDWVDLTSSFVVFKLIELVDDNVVAGHSHEGVGVVNVSKTDNY